ncbi:MAG: hypothetical protein JO344_01400 [Planctomycetaceae bacterium]|nr:hypothetical protein [Planctomycetaceae bacterium]
MAVGVKAMSIHLNDEDRANLERLEKRRMKPTRRQKAIALLRLAEGLTSSEAAMHAGIAREEVEAVAAEFARSGMAGVGLVEKSKTLVRLVRPGVGVQRYRLRKGATLADLVRRSKATTTFQAVYLDGVLAEETTPLHDGAVVMIVPQPKNAGVDEPWRATIPSFQDESLFREYMETLEARRHDLDADEDPER